MQKLLSIHGNKIIWHGEEVKTENLTDSIVENNEDDENLLEETNFEEIKTLPDVEIITSKNDTDFKIVTENLQNFLMLEDDNINIKSWGLNSSERKIQAFVIQTGQLVDSGIISLDERDKLIACARKIFK